MQTFTRHVAPLTEADLPGLGDGLALPDGRQFRAVRLDRTLTITTTGLAKIVPDGLANMYQGLIDGVGRYNPWA